MTQTRSGSNGNVTGVGREVRTPNLSHRIDYNYYTKRTKVFSKYATLWFEIFIQSSLIREHLHTDESREFFNITIPYANLLLGLQYAK